ncbi:MAG: methyltransferase domain-containing protein, partial [Minisyncoccia bacterium]
MLEEYEKSKIWQENIDVITLRSDILVSERVIELLDDIKGKKILDAGCGNGKVARKLASQGAIVWGVDKIADQIESAKEGSQNVEYRRGDISKLDELD